MSLVKRQEFSSVAAIDIWRELNAPFVSVLSIQYPSDVFQFEVSARLPRPKIYVDYIEFDKE